MTPGQPIPAVSVVMPTLNQAGFIAESVRSVMTQQVDALELIVCDGGSVDGTQSLLADLTAEFAPRLRWASVPDHGPADAVNKAVASSRAPIIGWLNSDDMYAPGAVRRALAHFEREPTHVMVYGEAEHVDVLGDHISRYPTMPPQTPLAAWADGCHICQPSAFWRRGTFEALGGLDTSLRAAFDFDFWLRLFKAYPGRIGYLPDVQARSRLHADAITMRMRESVALEGIEVLYRHLGPAPAHWLLTHFAELQARHPFQAEAVDLVARLHQLVQQAAAWLTEEGTQALLTNIQSHRALQLARPEFFAPVHADGWAPAVLDLRLRQPVRPYTRLRLHCRHASPRGGRLKLDVITPDGQSLHLEPRRGPFEIDLPLHEQRPHARQIFRVICHTPFVPALIEPGSTDARSLAYRVDNVELQPAP